MTLTFLGPYLTLTCVVADDCMKVLGSFKHAVQQHLRGERHVVSFTDLLNKLCAENLSKYYVSSVSGQYYSSVLV